MNSDFNIYFLFLPLFGFLIGLIVSIFGGGGGFFYVPLLTILFNIPVQVAVATSLASIIPTTVFGAFAHYKQGYVNGPIGLMFGFTGIIGTLIGVYLTTLIPTLVLKKLFGIVIILLVIPILFRVNNNNNNNNSEDKYDYLNVINFKKISISSFFGLLSGIMAGLFGVSGTPPVIAGLYKLRFPVRLVIGTSIFILFFNAVSGLLGHLVVGHINLTLIILLGGGAAVGARMGPDLLKKIKNDVLDKIFRIFFICLSILFGIIMIIK